MFASLLLPGIRGLEPYPCNARFCIGLDNVMVVEHAFTKCDGILMFHKFRRVLYFVYIDDTTSVLLKFPDGKREKLTLPVTSQLMVTYFVIILSKRSCLQFLSTILLCTFYA